MGPFLIKYNYLIIKNKTKWQNFSELFSKLGKLFKNNQKRKDLLLVFNGDFQPWVLDFQPLNIRQNKMMKTTLTLEMTIGNRVAIGLSGEKIAN